MADAPTLSPQDTPQPPQPPEVGRSLRLYRYQWVGLPVLGLIVVLALLGVFGNTSGEATARGDALALRVEHPTRFRYKEIAPLRVWVTNGSGRTIDTVRVHFATAYVLAFSNASFTPSVTAPFVVELAEVRPGETRLVAGELQAERYGSHEGTVAAVSASDSVAVAVETLVFP
jgi:hypothetical protein